jgi:hypothetical protein
MIPLGLVRVFLSLLFSARLTGVARALPFAENSPYYALLISELGRYVHQTKKPI